MLDNIKKKKKTGKKISAAASCKLSKNISKVVVDFF